MNNPAPTGKGLFFLFSLNAFGKLFSIIEDGRFCDEKGTA